MTSVDKELTLDMPRSKLLALMGLLRPQSSEVMELEIDVAFEDDWG